MKTLSQRPDLAPGDSLRLDERTWLLERPLKRGRHNDSWSAVHVESGQHSFLKIASGPDSISALRNEARILQAIESDFTPGLLAFESHAQHAGLVTRWLDGTPLSELMLEGPLSLSRVQSFGSSLWSALSALHQSGVFHGDLKPEHVLLHDTGVRLCDFGFASKDGETPVQGITPAYAAPEKLGLLHRPPSESSELYSSGLLILESLTGAVTWPSGDDLGRRLHLPPALTALLQGPRSLVAFLERLLQADPYSRYATVGSVAEDWERLWSSPSSFIHLGTGDRRTTLTAPALVGRQVELSALESYLLDHSSRPHWISARSGRGKSRLMRAAGEVARQHGRLVLWASGVAERGGSQGALNQWAGALATHCLGQIQQAATEPELQPSLRSLRQAFPELGLGQADGAPGAELNEFALCDALAQLLALLPRALVLCLDDAQWADSLTRTFLTLDLPKNIRTLVAFRDGEVQAARPSDPLMHLPRLDRQSSCQLLQSMSGPLPEEALETITERAQGEPFLLSALLLGAQEMGVLKEAVEGWRWEPRGALQTGLRAGAVLSERLKLCSEDERQLLQAGAVLGRKFTLSAAAALSGLPETRAEALQQGAIDRQLLWRLEGGRCSFCHDKIREGLLAGLRPERRRDLHEQAALWYEQSGRARPVTLAHHWTQAERPDLAFPHALRAGEEAFAQLDFASAIEQLSLARLSRPGSLAQPQDFQLHNQLAQAFDTSGCYDEALLAYQQALETAPDDQERVLILARMCLACGRANRLHQVDQLAEKGMRLLQDPMPGSSLGFLADTLASTARLAWRLYKDDIPEPGLPDPAFQARIRFRLTAGEAAAYQGQTGKLLWALVKGCEELTRRSSPADGALSWANAATLILMLGATRVSTHLFERARTAAGQNQRYLGQVISQSGMLPIVAGDLFEARDLFRRGLAMSISQGDRWNSETAQSYVALLDHALGDFGSAAEKALDIWQRQTLEETNFFGSLVILAKCGRAARFESLLLNSTRTRHETLRLEFLSTFALGLIYVHQNAPNKALPYLERACAKMTPELLNWGASAIPWLATTWRLLAEQLPPEATALRRKALRQASRAAGRGRGNTGFWVMTQPHALREHAIASASAGRFYLARSLFQQSWEISEKLGMAFESAWTLYERGRLAASAGWADWEGDSDEGQVRVRRLGAWIPGVQPVPSEPSNPLARLDRFERVLEAGRHLVSLQGEVLEKLAREAQTLLRCDRVEFVPEQAERPFDWSESLHQNCLLQGRAVTESEVAEPTRSLLLQEARSTLMAPLRVEGDNRGVLVAWQKSIGGFFGEEETRLADYLCALAGAGLENSRIMDERDHTLTALINSEQRFRGYFDYAGVGTALLAEDGRVLQENPYLRALLGGSVVEKTVWQLAHAADRDEWRAAFRTLAEGVSPRHDAEVRLHRSGGEVVWTQSCLVRLPVNDEGQARYLMTVADTTHRRIAEMMDFLENERRGLSAEIHDDLAQNLSALHTMLALQQVEDESLTRPRELAEQLVHDASNLIASLRNPLAEGVDLLSALKELVTRFSINEEAELLASWPAPFPQLSELRSLALYRVVQEGLTNVARHAGASRVNLTLRHRGNALELELTDDGRGFDPDPWRDRQGLSAHYGLISMKERADMVGATFDWTSAPGQGTRLTLCLPTSESQK